MDVDEHYRRMMQATGSKEGRRDPGTERHMAQDTFDFGDEIERTELEAVADADARRQRSVKADDLEPATPIGADYRSDQDQAVQDLVDFARERFARIRGASMPGPMVNNLITLAREMFDPAPVEPEYGPGRWANMRQTDLKKEMTVARPVDLLGAPPRRDIDLMMLHTVRMGVFLTTHYPSWDQTLPSCWLLHDDIVHEVFSLKCYMDLVVGSGNGGLYMPTLQALIHQALDRVKDDLKDSNAKSDDHRHHLSDTEAREREAARRAAYAQWYRHEGEWAPVVDPGLDEHERAEAIRRQDFDPGYWGYRMQEIDGMTGEMTPAASFMTDQDALDDIAHLPTGHHVEYEAEVSDGSLRSDLAAWRVELEATRHDFERALARDDDDARRDVLKHAGLLEEKARRRWLEYRSLESKERDRLDRALSAAGLRLRDDDGSMRGEDRRRLMDETRRIRDVLREHGRSPSDDGYTPLPLGLQRDDVELLERLTDNGTGTFDRIERLLGTIGKVFDDERHE